MESSPCELTVQYPLQTRPIIRPLVHDNHSTTFSLNITVFGHIPPPKKLAPFRVGEIWTPSNTLFLRPTRPVTWDGSLIASVIFAQYTVVTNRPTDRQNEHGNRPVAVGHLRVMWPENNDTTITHISQLYCCSTVQQKNHMACKKQSYAFAFRMAESNRKYTSGKLRQVRPKPKLSAQSQST